MLPLLRICVRLMGYVVLQCDAETNTGRARNGVPKHFWDVELF